MPASIHEEVHADNMQTDSKSQMKERYEHRKPTDKRESQYERQKAGRKNEKKIGERNLLLLLGFDEVVRVVIVMYMIN
jgi:hypothetical protein